MRFALIILALLVSAQGAVAQINLNSSPAPPSTFSDQTIRVTTAFRTPLVADNQTAPDTKSQETARRELYRMAESECGGLSEIYKAECHLISVSVNLPFVVAPNTAPPNALSATAVYELRRNRTP